MLRGAAARAAAICHNSRGKCTIAIRRETKNMWERRAPLTPKAVEQLVKKDGARVLVQPSSKRVFADTEYAQAGAAIDENLDAADIVLGVKEVPSDALLPEKAYMFFSHTHKGQPHNAPMLAEIVQKRIELLDYELLADPATGKRLVMFGEYAGYAGLLDGLHGLGLRLLGLGFGSPLLSVATALAYGSVRAAQAHLSGAISGLIRDGGFDARIGPVVVVLTGTGNVARGARALLECLPTEWVTPEQLPALSRNYSRHKVYAVQVTAADYIQRASGTAPWALQEYYDHPERFLSVFHERIAPYALMLVNGIYWEPRYPRLLTKDQLAALYASQTGAALPRPVHLADIGCDIGGPFEFVDRATTIGAPFFLYDASTGTSRASALEGPGMHVMSIDNLPTELPREASEHFSSGLYPHIRKLARGGRDAIRQDPVLRGATIVGRGGVLNKERFPALEALVAQQGHNAGGDKQANATVRSNERRVLVLGSGYVSAPVLDAFAKSGRVTVATNNAREGRALVASRPHATLEKIDLGDSSHLSKRVAAHDVVVSLVPASMHVRVAQACISSGVPLVTASYVSPEMQALDGKAQKANVLLFNEIGLDPGIDHLTAKRLIDDAQSRGERITSFVSYCGGLPAPEDSDVPLAYKFSWSPRGVLLAAANGALWRELGVERSIAPGRLLATGPRPFDRFPGFSLEGYANRDSLQYLEPYGLTPAQNGGRAVDTMFRGTLRYRGYTRLLAALERLGLTRAEPVPVAQLRGKKWRDLISEHIGRSVNTPDEAAAALGLCGAAAKPVVDAVAFLGLCGADGQFPDAVLDGRETAAILDGFAHVLESKCRYAPSNPTHTPPQPGERDLVLLHHAVQAERPDGTRVEYTSSLIEYGSPWSGTRPGAYTAMARTVGIPAASAARLILDGAFGKVSGVHKPISPQFYVPLLDALERQGLNFRESMRPL